MVEYHLERLDNENAAKWEAFNNNSPDGSFFHSLKWIQIAGERSTIKTHNFILFRNDTVVGLFPFVEHNDKLFRGLVPAFDPQRLYAILQDYRDPSCMQYTLSALQKNDRDLKKISYIWFSTPHREAMDIITSHPLFPCSDEGDLVVDLAVTPPEKIWNAFSSNKGQRKKIRRFDDHGFELIEVKTNDELKLFYSYYEENTRYIGGNPRPYSHFSDLWNYLSSDEMRITLLRKDSTVAGGFLMFMYRPRNTVYSAFVSLNRNLPTTYHPSYYLYWDLINWAWENNYERISFGAQQRDETNSRYRIKKEFGAQFYPIYSGIIPLRKIFSMGIKYKKILGQRRS